MAAVVNFYVFKFQKNKFWAFSQMGIYKKYLKNVRGLKFFRLLGTGGKTGFGLYPDFKTYCFLSVWEDVDYANHFTRKSDFFSKYFELDVSHWNRHNRTMGIPITINNKDARKNKKERIVLWSRDD